ncbi:MAG: CPBP family glutamic-type intramembrane protease [Actinomycetota bacterium]|nr:CPBP family glutamic-type intramembrane protease [Actinomycetota bacterium]
MTDAASGGPQGSTFWEMVGPQYIAAPDWQQIDADERRPVASLATWWLVGLGGAWILGMVLQAVAGPAGFHSNIEDSLDELPAYGQFLLLVVLAPLVEETLFRLPLKAELRLPLLVVSGLLASFYFLGASWIIVVLGLALAVGAIAVMSRPAAAERSSRWWQANARCPVWISAALFALMHLLNYDIDWSIVAVLAVPLVVSPQLWLGLMFTTARVRLGWWAGVVVHAMHNLTVWTVASLLL